MFPIYANGIYCFQHLGPCPKKPQKEIRRKRRVSTTSSMGLEQEDVGSSPHVTTLVAGRTTHVSVDTDPSLNGKNRPVSYLDDIPVSPALPRKLVKLVDSK